MPGTIQRANRQIRKPDHPAFSSTSYHKTSLASTHTVRVEAFLIYVAPIQQSTRRGTESTKANPEDLEVLKALQATEPSRVIRL
jgi:hypothetical protein